MRVPGALSGHMALVLAQEGAPPDNSKAAGGRPRKRAFAVLLARDPNRCRAKPVKRHVTVVFLQEIEEPLVLFPPHVEELDDDFVAPVSLFEPARDELADVITRQIAGHECRIDGRPKPL